MYKFNVPTRFAAMDGGVKTLLMQFNNIVFAGGGVRNITHGERPEDYDMFFVGDNDNIDEVKEFITERLGWSLVFVCPRGELFTFKLEGVKLQIINKRVYVDVEDLIRSFDFSACCWATCNAETLYVLNEAVRTQVTGRCSLVNLEFPVATVNRIGKYQRKGFWMGEVIKEILESIAMMHYDEYLEMGTEVYID